MTMTCAEWKKAVFDRLERDGTVDIDLLASELHVDGVEHDENCPPDCRTEG